MTRRPHVVVVGDGAHVIRLTSVSERAPEIAATQDLVDRAVDAAA